VSIDRAVLALRETDGACRVGCVRVLFCACAQVAWLRDGAWASAYTRPAKPQAGHMVNSPSTLIHTLPSTLQALWRRRARRS